MATDGSARAVAMMILAFAASPAVASPAIDHWVMDNGARVFFVASQDLPMVSVNVAFDAGSARDPSDQPGLAMLSNAMINEGTGDLDAGGVAAGFERLGAEYGAHSDRDMAGVSLRSLSDPELLNPAADLLARLIREPSMPAAAFERERGRALLGLRQASQSPGNVASKALYARVYGHHPYGHPPEGTEAGLQSVARNDLVTFHDRYYVGRNAVLSIVGDLKPAEARKLARRILGALPAGRAAPALVSVPDTVSSGTRREKFISHPASQSHVLVAQPAMTRNDPDYFPLYVGNYVLGGGGFVSRLMKAVRDQRGLSYSVYSYFYPLRERGPFILGLQTKNSQRAEALRVVRQVLNKFLQEGPTEQELEAAKKNLTGGFPLRIDSNRKISEYLTVIGSYNLPLNYLDTFIPRIQAITSAEVRDAFRRRIQPDRLATVIVGGAAK